MHTHSESKRLIERLLSIAELHFQGHRRQPHFYIGMLLLRVKHNWVESLRELCHHKHDYKEIEWSARQLTYSLLMIRIFLNVINFLLSFPIRSSNAGFSGQETFCQNLFVYIRHVTHNLSNFIWRSEVAARSLSQLVSWASGSEGKLAWTQNNLAIKASFQWSFWIFFLEIFSRSM